MRHYNSARPPARLSIDANEMRLFWKFHQARPISQRWERDVKRIQHTCFVCIGHFQLASSFSYKLNASPHSAGQSNGPTIPSLGKLIKFVFFFSLFSLSLILTYLKLSKHTSCWLGAFHLANILTFLLLLIFFSLAPMCFNNNLFQLLFRMWRDLCGSGYICISIMFRCPVSNEAT